MISTDKKSKNPIAKLFKAKSKGFTLTTDVNGMNSLFHQKKMFTYELYSSVRYFWYVFFIEISNKCCPVFLNL